MRMDSGWLYATGICQSAKSSVELVPSVRQPRVRHRDQGRFSSAILPGLCAEHPASTP
jgi:hypothetical protein